MVDFSFSAIQQRVLARLRASNNWGDILYNSVNYRLIDAFSAELAYASQNGSMLLYESKWNLALNRSSLLSQTDFFSYNVFRKIGATGTLKISTSETFNATYPIQILIPKYSMFSNGNNIYLCCTEDSVLFPNQEYISIPVVQGIAQSVSYVAAGNNFETIIVNNDSIENYIYDLYVNGNLWTKVDNIRLATSGTDLVYTLKNKIDFSGIILRAGNDYFGKKLEAQDAIEFKYIETLGDTGNILSTDIITTVESNFIDNNSNPVDLFCTNLTAIEGGSTYEDTESIRANAPRFYQTGNRAIGLIDYMVILEAYSFIVKTNAWGESEYNIDNGNPLGTYISTQENVIHLCGMTTTGESISNAQETTIRNDINLIKPPSDIIQFEPVLSLYLIFNITAYISDRSYTGAVVTQNLITALSNAYSINLAEFKKPIYNSDYISMIDQVAGIDHHTTSIDLYALKSFTTAYEADLSVFINDMTPSTIKVYYKTINATTWTLLATDDGVGNWNMEGGYSGSGSVIYNTGECNITIVSGISGDYIQYELKVVFSKDSNDVLLQKRSQILVYGDSLITTSYMQ
jgi:hypothetical protein